MGDRQRAARTSRERSVTGRSIIRRKTSEPEWGREASLRACAIILPRPAAPRAGAVPPDDSGALETEKFRRLNRFGEPRRPDTGIASLAGLPPC